jgi:GTPase SAR1 family protein
MTAVYGLKFVVIGDSNVGKSQLLRNFTKKPFNVSMGSLDYLSVM